MSAMTASSTLPRNSSTDLGQTATIRIGFVLFVVSGVHALPFPTAAVYHSSQSGARSVNYDDIGCPNP